MNNDQKNTAILFFSNSAEVEIREKQFSFSSKKAENKRLANLLIDYNFDVCKSTGFPVEFIDSSLQRGKTFGERLNNAFKDVFAKGYKNVIAVGSDCLELKNSDLNLAIEAVQKNQVALGPCKDGGIYLLGLTEHQFNHFDFDAVDWKTSKVFTQLSDLLDKDWDCVIFNQKTDLDSAQDLFLAIKNYGKLNCTSKISLLRSLILSYSVPFISRIFSRVSFFYREFLQRGPPVSTQA